MSLGHPSIWQLTKLLSAITEAGETTDPIADLPGMISGRRHDELIASYVGMLVCWYVGMLVCWYVGMLVCWYVGMLVC
ncbi:MAG: hypothetical protein V7752_08715, partial [Halopseudomonas sp.]